MKISLGSLLAKFAPKVSTSVSFLTGELPDDVADSLDEYAKVGTWLEIGGTVLQQSTPSTCGAMAALVARLSVDPELTAELSGNEDAIRALEESIHRDATHRALGPFSWPRALGTPPWTLTDTMADATAPIGVGKYRSMPVDDASENGWNALQWAYHAAMKGVPSALFTGDNAGNGLHKAVPRHVVLVMPMGSALLPETHVGMTPDGIPEVTIFDPSTGKIFQVPLFALARRSKKMSALGNWTHVVWAVLPDRPTI